MPERRKPAGWTGIILFCPIAALTGRQWGILLSLLDESAPAQCLQHGFKFRRKRAGEGYQGFCAGVDELQPHGVEALAGQSRDRFFGAIHRIPQNRMANMGHVYADLMGAACFQAAAHMGVAAEAFQYLPVGHSVAAAAVGHRHFFSICGVAADGGVHCARIVAEISGADGFIGARESVVGQLGGEEQVGRVVFGGNDEP